MLLSSRRLVSLALLAPAVLLAACDGADISDVEASGSCHPYDGATCLAPWPSSAYLAVDPSTATGYRVDLPPEAMPANINDLVVDPTTFNRYDGFSPSGAVIAWFAGGVSGDGLPGPADIASSLDDDAPILFFAADTGERVPYFAERDSNAPTPEDAALLIRPVVRLAPATRYVVAVRDSLSRADGGALERPPGFATLVDGGSLPGERGARLTAGADSMFAAIEAQGVDRGELAVAWDFVTASDESMTRELLAMRDAALPAMGEAGALLEFSAEEVASDNEHVLRLLVGTYDAPSFLDRGEHEETRIVRDEEGTPVLGGTMKANFAAIVPRCVETATEPVPVILFGHGLFGSSAGYTSDDLLQQAMDDYCAVMIAGDWIGLSERQLALTARAANDINRVDNLSDMLGQSVINFIALEHLARGAMRDSALFQGDHGPILDADNVSYLGASLGGIMGGTFMAYDPFIERGALGVPGGAWSMLIERSNAWSLLKGPAQNAYPSPGDYQLLVALLSWSFERWDPITTAPRVLDDPLPGTPPKQLFLYEAVNDSLVTNLSTEMVVRTLGVPMTGPSVREPFGIDVTTEAVPSAFTIYDEGVAPGPETNEPPLSDNGTHSGVNERPAVLRQIEGFLLGGAVAHECALEGEPAPCDCTTGACE